MVGGADFPPARGMTARSDFAGLDTRWAVEARRISVRGTPLREGTREPSGALARWFRGTPVVILQSAREALVDRGAQQPEHPAQGMVRDGVDVIAPRAAADVGAAALDAVGMAREEKRGGRVNEPMGTPEAVVALPAAQDVAVHELLERRAVPACQVGPAVWTVGHRWKLIGADTSVLSDGWPRQSISQRSRWGNGGKSCAIPGCCVVSFWAADVACANVAAYHAESTSVLISI